MFKKIAIAILAASTALAVAAPAQAQSGARRQQERQQAQIPTCARPLGALSVIEPDNNWWSGLGLSSPESIIKLFVARSGCFTLVDRNRGLQNRNLERALADNGELQPGSNIGRGQVRAADYFLVPDIVTQNANSGGGGIGAALGGLGGLFGGRAGYVAGSVAGGLNVRSSEANVTLSLVNARTTEQERITEGFARRRDTSFNLGAGGFLGGGFASFGGGAYENTQIGQVIVLAYLNAYTDMVRQLGGLPANASAAAPIAR
jgi:curli biogenesis system outer membrane secretion channel CsgG